MVTEPVVDQAAMRERPPGNPLLLQNWENLLFLHWPVDPEILRPKIPAPLELDLFDGQAWIGITPFAMTAVRLNSLPSIPGYDSFLELNVRTCVHCQGMPGVYFFSLDASKAMPAVAARVAYSLPYFKSRMEFSGANGEFRFHSRRVNSRAEFSARWRIGRPLGEAGPESLEFFLVERYALFAAAADKVILARIHHRPWKLEAATMTSYHSTIVSALGLAEPAVPPLAHFSRFQAVETWEPRLVQP
ncbi:MAG TPA: DUF2071 domain-containing protein [Verrucomicrobiae bacterium]|nr:DUF2071 domain-containing protein [Verrucomicrobiae bacterium]